ncbi:MAG: hypothetical protein WKI04_18570, partial [Ferruginibacter sp.]
MPQSPFSRRNFIATVAAGVTTVANFSPLNGFAQVLSEEQPASSDRPIRITSTGSLSQDEQERIRALSKNIDLQIVRDQGSVALRDAEVIIGDIDASMLQHMKQLKWVQVLHAGVENLATEMIAHPLVLTNM